MTKEGKETVDKKTVKESKPKVPGKKKKPASSGSKDKARKIEKAYADLNEKFLRLAAEFDNYKKRIERDISSISFRAEADLLSSLLPVLDDFERSFAQDKKKVTEEQFREGIELIVKKLHATLAERGLKPIDAVNKEFDPEKHDALLQVENDESDSDIVIEEHLKGYEFKERILRHSKVIVSK